MDIGTSFTPLYNLLLLFGFATFSVTNINGKWELKKSNVIIIYNILMFIIISILVWFQLYIEYLRVFLGKFNIFGTSTLLISIGNATLFSLAHFSTIVDRSKCCQVYSKLFYLSNCRKVTLNFFSNFVSTTSLLFFSLALLVVTGIEMKNKGDFYVQISYVLFLTVEFSNIISGTQISYLIQILSSLLKDLKHSTSQLVGIGSILLANQPTPSLFNEFRVDVRRPESLPRPVEPPLTHKPLEAPPGGVGSVQHFVSQVVCLSETYESLHKASEEVGELFGPQLLVTCAHVFVITTYTLYIMFLMILDSKSMSVSDLTPLSLATWAVHHAVKFLVLVKACSSATNQADRLASEVSSLLRNVKEPKIREELQLFSLQLLHNKVRFTACGFFPIDATLLHGVVAGVTTYLVILIQFQLASEPKET